MLVLLIALLLPRGHVRQRCERRLLLDETVAITLAVFSVGGRRRQALLRLLLIFVLFHVGEINPLFRALTQIRETRHLRCGVAGRTVRLAIRVVVFRGM